MTAEPLSSNAPAPNLVRDVVEAGVAGDARKGLASPRRGVAIGAVLAAMTMVVVDGGLSNVALPTIATSLRVTPARAVLVMTAYQAAVVMMLLPSAALGERFGYRRVFGAGVALFAAASMASALAPSLPWLIGARFAQGLGGAAILALGVALLRFSVSDSELGAAIGWNALTVALAAAAGPPIGALIISLADWHWLYAANVALGVVVITATRALPFVAPHQQRIDVLSIALNCGGIGLLVAGVNAVAGAPLVAASLVLVAAATLAVLVLRERPKPRPLVPIDLLRNSSFALSVVASIFCFTGQTAALVALPFYLQHGPDQTPAMTGIYLAAWPLSVALAAPLAGRATRLVPSGWLCALGAALLTAGLAATAAWPLKDDLLPFPPMLMMCGVGFGLFQVANNRSMFLTAPATRSAAAGGMQGTARLLGQTAGALLVAQLFALTSAASPQIAIGVGAVFTLAAGLVSLLRAGRPLSASAPRAANPHHPPEPMSVIETPGDTK